LHRGIMPQALGVILVLLIPRDGQILTAKWSRNGEPVPARLEQSWNCTGTVFEHSFNFA
jgi:hypothetical protein